MKRKNTIFKWNYVWCVVKAESVFIIFICLLLLSVLFVLTDCHTHTLLSLLIKFFTWQNNNGIWCAECVVKMVIHISETCRMSLNHFHITVKRSFSLCARRCLFYLLFLFYPHFPSSPTTHDRFRVFFRLFSTSFLFIFSTHLVPHPVCFTFFVSFFCYCWLEHVVCVCRWMWVGVQVWHSFNI